MYRSLSAIILLLLFACKKDNPDQVPHVPVNISLYSSDAQFFPLQTVGGFAYLNGGSRGILVYRRSNDEFAAFDRHCTYDVSNPCGVVEVTSNGFSIVDSCCGSAFQIYDGLVSKGPATYPLKSYQTTYDGYELNIFN